MKRSNRWRFAQPLLIILYLGTPLESQAADDSEALHYDCLSGQTKPVSIGYCAAYTNVENQCVKTACADRREASFLISDACLEDSDPGWVSSLRNEREARKINVHLCLPGWNACKEHWEKEERFHGEIHLIETRHFDYGLDEKTKDASLWDKYGEYLVYRKQLTADSSWYYFVRGDTEFRVECIGRFQGFCKMIGTLPDRQLGYEFKFHTPELRNWPELHDQAVEFITRSMALAAQQ